MCIIITVDRQFYLTKKEQDMKNIDRKKGVLDVEGTRQMNMLWHNLKRTEKPKRKNNDLTVDQLLERMFEDES